MEGCFIDYRLFKDPGEMLTYMSLEEYQEYLAQKIVDAIFKNGDRDGR